MLKPTTTSSTTLTTSATMPLLRSWTCGGSQCSVWAVAARTGRYTFN
jgi:hypothetical protein